MDPIGERLLDVIRPEIGYREEKGQYTKYGEWYAEKVGDPQYRNAPWCDMFLAWAAEQAGVGHIVGQFAWTPSHANWFKRHEAWSHTPEPGALVFFDWQRTPDSPKNPPSSVIDHVGIVEKVVGNKIHTIEANVDRVWVKRKVRGQKKVVGYGLPNKVKEYQEATAHGGDAAKVFVLKRPETETAAFLGPIPVSPFSLPVIAAMVLFTVVTVTLARIRARWRAAALRTGRHRRRSGRHTPPPPPPRPARRGRGARTAAPPSADPLYPLDPVDPAYPSPGDGVDTGVPVPDLTPRRFE